MHVGAQGRRILVAVAASVALLASATTAAVAAPSGGYAPKIDPADFSTTIDNPYLPLTPGARWVYEGRTKGGLERIEVVVTDQAKTVMGVDVVVVHDTVTLEGVVIEDTFDWFAQDSDGSVWYFGEDTTEFEGGVPVGKKGAWEAGVDGALPGIAMLAHPEVGDRYRQEYARGVAEDRASVVSTTSKAEVPFGTFAHLVKTRDVNPLDPGPVEHKFYAKGVGLVLERELRGGSGRVELVEHT
jgi:hypothetical protein